MTNPLKTRQEKFLFSMLITFMWGLAAHGYRFFNLDLSHDSLLVFQELDIIPMVSIGRFLHPVYFLLRGDLYAPSLVGLLSLIFLGCSVFLTAELLHRNTWLEYTILSGIMTVNAVITLTAATYIHDLDIYTLSLLLAVFSVTLCRRSRLGFLYAIIPTVASLALYQSYIQVAMALHIILAILSILRQEDIAAVFREGWKAAVSLVASLLLYYLLYQLILRLCNIPVSTAYNSPSQSSIFGDVWGMLHQVAVSVYLVVRYFVFPASHHPGVMALTNVLLLLIGVACMVRIVLVRKIRGAALLLLAALVLVLPLAISFACFLSPGIVHTLMLYACVFVYVLIDELFRLFLAVGVKTSAGGGRVTRLLCSRLVPLLLSATILLGIVYSNQVYLKKALEAQSTVSMMTRILNRIEQTEGYVYGQTPVAFAGLLDSSPISVQQDDFDYWNTGLWHSYSVSSPESYERYIHNVLNYDMNLLDAGSLSETEEVKAMGIFPAADSVRNLNGTIVVKLSEDMPPRG